MKKSTIIGRVSHTFHLPIDQSMSAFKIHL